MKTKKMSNYVIVGIYAFAVLATLGILYFCIISVNNYFSDTSDLDYSINGIIDNSKVMSGEKHIPVVSDLSIVMPYKGENITVGREFYDMDSESAVQEKAIIFYENTYIQNTGIDYVSDTEFEVVSILPGKVVSIEDDENLGSIIKIEHDKDITSVYEGVGSIGVKVGDSVSPGQVIAKSGSSNINRNFNSSLHFEVFKGEEIINPNKFYASYKENN